MLKSPASGPIVKLQMSTTPQQFTIATRVGPELFDKIGDQGYGIVIDSKHIVLAARSIRGMRHALTTLGQIAADRTVLPAWRSVTGHRSISRRPAGHLPRQVPTPATLKRLATVLAQAKMNNWSSILSMSTSSRLSGHLASRRSVSRRSQRPPKTLPPWGGSASAAANPWATPTTS